jgi:cytochrome c-type biogenesis protein CcmF
MIIHPPMLYLGYVGMTIPFGIAAGALLRGELGDAWLVPLRKWTLVPWIFLSIGIILGSWWAYAVLGWGGYWAWDPVENASFMPWLTATAFMHSTMVLEKKKSLKLWTIALALASFILTIVGTFMAVRGHMLVAESNLGSIASREGSILLNNLVFAALTFVVLLGTLYPLITEGLFDKKITVGEPYFNQMALPLGLAMLFLMGVGPMLPWGQADPKVVQRQAIVPGVIGLLVAAACYAAGFRGAMPLATFGVAGFVTVVTLRELFLPAQQRMTEQKESMLTAVFVSASRARRRFGGYVVHLGIVAIVVAVAASSAYKVHATGTLQLGQAMQIGDYKVRFDGLSNGKEPHRDWIAANITVIRPNGEESKAHGTNAPRMNFYERSNDPIGSPSVTEMIVRDIYVSMLSYDGKANTATFNMWVFPMVGWIWYAIPLLVLGTLIALWPQRKQAKVPAAAPADAVPGAAP